MSCNVVVLAAILFAAIAVFVAMSTSTMMVEEAERTVRSVAKSTVGRIDRLMADVQTAVDNSAWIVGEHLNDPDYMYRITRELVGKNEFIVGSAVAFISRYFPEKGHFFSPYSYLDVRGEIASKQLGTDTYDYFSQEWFAAPYESGKSRWSDPYLDEGGGGILMCTYSVPIKDAEGRIYAIMTADLSLEQLRGYVAAIRPYAQSYATLSTEKGEPIVRPPQELVNTIGETINIRDHAENGWAVEIVCPMDDILRGERILVTRIILFSIAGLGVIFLLSSVYSTRLQRATAARQRIESELQIASQIQSGLLPKVFPAYLAARLRPAREVGGDLYDFIERNGKVYFLIGDASGKGVPAALFSFMAVTAFRLACAHGFAPSEIMAHINGVLARGNEMSMFVTAFVGVLDRESGTLDYCCAGHNPPVVANPDGTAEFLPVIRNLPCGVMEDRAFAAQSAVLKHGSQFVLYTDGVTEAERADKAQYGESRLMNFAIAHASESAAALIGNLFVSVDRFVSGAEQSDDITAIVLNV